MRSKSILLSNIVQHLLSKNDLYFKEICAAEKISSLNECGKRLIHFQEQTFFFFMVQQQLLTFGKQQHQKENQDF